MPKYTPNTVIYMMATLMTKTGAAVRPDDDPPTAFGKDHTLNHYLIIHDQSFYLKHTRLCNTPMIVILL